MSAPGTMWNTICIFLLAATVWNPTIATKECKKEISAFEAYKVVPDVIPAAPYRFLKVVYDSGVYVSKGNELTPTQVKNKPQVKWSANPCSYYTLIMTDPDAPSDMSEFLHWMVVNIPGNDVSKGDEIAGYIPSGPPENSGLHRYVFLLYKQERLLEFSEPHVASNSAEHRTLFSAKKFATKYSFHTAYRGNFFRAQYDDYVPTIHANAGIVLPPQ